MMKCFNCGTENPDGAKYCGNCGKKLSLKRYCLACGIELQTNFCMQCGRPAVQQPGDCCDAQGKSYRTVQIGAQEWMAENLAVTVDRNGNELVLGKDYFYPGGDVNNVEKYGLFYTWEVANRIAPKGWHLPTDKEWTELEDYCSEHYAAGGDKDNIAKALASTTGWDYSDDTYAVGNDPSSNNKSGFSALPAGGYSGSSVDDVGGNALFWSATSGSSYNARTRYFYYCFEYVECGDYNKYSGCSVRCVRD